MYKCEVVGCDRKMKTARTAHPTPFGIVCWKHWREWDKSGKVLKTKKIKENRK